MPRPLVLVWLLACLLLAGCGAPGVPAAPEAENAPLTLQLPGQAPVDVAPVPDEAPGIAQVEDDPPETTPAAGAAVSGDLPPPINPYAAGSTPETTRTGEDWPIFLGLRGTGVSGETGLLEKWPKDGPPIVWEQEIGTGYSAPSVRGNRLVVHHRLRNDSIVDCFTADTGKPLWQFKYTSYFQDPYGYNNGPRCTPLLTENRCYTFGAEGMLHCLDLESGNKIWSRDTAQDFDVPEAFFGVGSTPILFGDLLIVMVGGRPKSGLVAFQADSGETVWENVGKNAWTIPEDGYDIDDKLASYSSIFLGEIHGRQHLLAWFRDGMVSVDPKDGNIQFNYFFRSRSFESVNAARPLILGDQIFLSAAYRAGSVLLKVAKDGQSVEEVWQNRSLETHWSTTIHQEGYLYGFSGRHEGEALFRCVKLDDGEVVWETDGLPPGVALPAGKPTRDEEYPYGRGSAIVAEKKFIVLGERGVLALVEVNPEKFVEISRIKFEQMQYPAWAAPVLSRGRLYLRDEDTLICLDLAKR